MKWYAGTITVDEVSRLRRLAREIGIPISFRKSSRGEDRRDIFIDCADPRRVDDFHRLRRRESYSGCASAG